MAETETDLMEDVTGHDAEEVCPTPDAPPYDRRTAESLAALSIGGRSSSVECEAGHWHVTE